jgi:hypothetical protein
MKISATSIAKFALLTLAASLAMTAFAQNPYVSSVPSVSGILWVGTDSDGDHYEYAFMPNGALYYKSPSGFHTFGTWKQDGDTIYMETNNKYSEYQGRIAGTHIDGKAWNLNNRTWTWVADKQNLPASAANGGVPTISETSWTVSASNGDRYEFSFVADGTLRYSHRNGSYTNGTWKQDTDSIYIQMDSKNVEWQGRVSGTHMEGNGWNTKNEKWTWEADKK